MVLAIAYDKNPMDHRVICTIGSHGVHRVLYGPYGPWPIWSIERFQRAQIALHSIIESHGNVSVIIRYDFWGNLAIARDPETKALVTKRSHT